MCLEQHIASLTWILCKSPVDESVLADHERTLGVAFPDDFRVVIQLCPGGQPLERSDFDFHHPVHGPVGSCLGGLVTLGPVEDVEGMLFATYGLREHHSVDCRIIPFARDGGGDYMCFDFRDDPGHPPVVYWSRSARPGTRLAHLADSFTEFLGLLQPPED